MEVISLTHDLIVILLVLGLTAFLFFSEIVRLDLGARDHIGVRRYFDLTSTRAFVNSNALGLGGGLGSKADTSRHLVSLS